MAVPRREGPDIFILCAHEDSERVRPIVEILKEVGWQVWWEISHFEVAQQIDHRIQDTLRRAKCVVVFWSKASVESRYMEQEAYWALENSKLLSVIIEEGLNPPISFNATETYNLCELPGDTSSNEFQEFARDLIEVIGIPEGSPVVVRRGFHLQETRFRTLPEALQKQLATRAFIETSKRLPPTVAASVPSDYPPPADSSSPLAGRRDKWASRQAPFPVLRAVIRFAAIAGAIALAAWAGLKFLPLIFGTTTSSSKLRNPDESSDDNNPVDCSVFAPPKLALGDEILVQVFLHPPEMAADAEAGARRFDSDAEWRGFTSLSLDLASGTRVAVQLVAGDLEVSDDGCGEIRWRDGVVGVSFLVKAPEYGQPGKRHGTVHLLVEGVPAGRIHFVIDVKASLEEEAPPEPLGDDVHRYRKAFISYASEDRTEVVKRVQTLGALKIKYFQDLLDLDPGDRWERRLYKEIDDCDLFLLFWSSASKGSEWVHKEAAYARDRQIRLKTDEPSIVPMLIEGPPPPEPWPEFSHLHFNDKLIYLMRCEEDG